MALFLSFVRSCFIFCSLCLLIVMHPSIWSEFQYFIGPFSISLSRSCARPAAPSNHGHRWHFSDLSRNRLAKVTNGAFVNLSNLTYLDLSYNKLVKLESASVEPLRKLHTLNISGNIQMDLYDIREAFQVISPHFCFPPVSIHIYGYLIVQYVQIEFEYLDLDVWNSCQNEPSWINSFGLVCFSNFFLSFLSNYSYCIISRHYQ